MFLASPTTHDCAPCALLTLAFALFCGLAFALFCGLLRGFLGVSANDHVWNDRIWELQSFATTKVFKLLGQGGLFRGMVLDKKEEERFAQVTMLEIGANCRF